METSLSVPSKSLLGGAKKPSTKLCTPVGIFNLFIILKVIPYEKVRTFAFPKTATNPLLSTTTENTESVPIGHLHYYISARIHQETFYTELTLNVFVGA